jgi:hypothetical protein
MITKREHQQKEFDGHKDSKLRALFWYMRAGKTKAAIDWLQHNYTQNRIKWAVVLAPNGVHENWVVQELPKHMTVPYTAIAFHNDLKKHQWFNIKINRELLDGKDDLKIFCIPKSALSSPFSKRRVDGTRDDSLIYSVIKELIKIYDKSKSTKTGALIVDESHNFGEVKALTALNAAKMSEWMEYKMILSGTPIHEGLYKAYLQFKILSPDILGAKTYESFKEKFVIEEMVGKSRLDKVTQQVKRIVHPKIVGYKNESVLHDLVSPYTSVVTRQDIGLCERECIYRKGRMSTVTLAFYNKLVKDKMLEGIYLDNEVINQKLSQISSGFIYIDTLGGRKTHVIEKPKDNIRFQMLENDIDKEQKTIVWVLYQYEVEAVTKYINEVLEIEAISFTGSNEERLKKKNRFLNVKSCKVLVSQPKRLQEGHDLSKADTMIWFNAPTYPLASFTTYDQANERLSDISSKTVTIIHFQVEEAEDEAKFLLIQNKQEASVENIQAIKTKAIKGNLLGTPNDF